MRCAARYRPAHLPSRRSPPLMPMPLARFRLRATFTVTVPDLSPEALALPDSVVPREVPEALLHALLVRMLAEPESARRLVARAAEVQAPAVLADDLARHLSELRRGVYEACLPARVALERDDQDVFVAAEREGVFGDAVDPLLDVVTVELDEAALEAWS